MIRWRFILPRVLFVIVVLLVLRYAVPPIVKLATVKTLQTATGAKVELASVDVGLFPPRLHYHDVHLANPGKDKAMRNLAQAESIELVIDGAALLRRRYVISDATVTGLQFDSERLTSGHLDHQADRTPNEPSAAMTWLAGIFGSATEAAKDQIESLAEQSETRRRGDQIRRRWKTEYEQLSSRAEALEAAIKEVHETTKGIDNPLRDWPRVDVALTKARDIQQELVSVRKTLDSLPAQVQVDLLSMERAKQADIKRARDLLPIDLTGDDAFGPGLLSQAVRSQIDQARGYLETGREVSRWTITEPTFERLRGEMIDLEQGTRLPSTLVKRCEVAGSLTASGQRYQLAGILENLTTQPKLRPEPLRARLRLDGEGQTVRLDYVRDDSTDVANESLTMHWPDLKAPTIRLGSDDSLELDVRDGRLELWVQLNTRGDQVDGRIVSRRIDTTIELSGSERIARTPMFTTMRDTLATIDRVEIDAKFNGTWQKPQVTINTNLTAVLKSGIREATEDQIAQTRERVEAEIDRVYAKQVGELQQWLAGQQMMTNELLAKADNTVQDVSRKVMSETNKADAYLGRLRGTPPSLK
jgi:uncharacterized protein (TIGR03545 family)